MLARRFTIVCLLVTIFGMGLASLVAEAGHSRKMRAKGAVAPCAFGDGLGCAR